MNEIMFYGGIAGAIVFGLIAVSLFLHFHIYTVIGNLTGLNAKRSIAKLQQEGYVSGVAKEKAIRVQTEEIHARRGKTTAKLPVLQASSTEDAGTTVLMGNNAGLMFEIIQNVQIIHTTERI